MALPRPTSCAPRSQAMSPCRGSDPGSARKPGHRREPAPGESAAATARCHVSPDPHRLALPLSARSRPRIRRGQRRFRDRALGFALVHRHLIRLRRRWCANWPSVACGALGRTDTADQRDSMKRPIDEIPRRRNISRVCANKKARLGNPGITIGLRPTADSTSRTTGAGSAIIQCGYFAGASPCVFIRPPIITNTFHAAVYGAEVSPIPRPT